MTSKHLRALCWSEAEATTSDLQQRARQIRTMAFSVTMRPEHPAAVALLGPGHVSEKALKQGGYT
jgi:hypothetical protein